MGASIDSGETQGPGNFSYRAVKLKLSPAPPKMAMHRNRRAYSQPGLGGR